MSFTVYPAIDVRGGCVVRLRQGDYAHETCYDRDPFEVARRYAQNGARWLHLVDLDAAREGGYTLLPLLARIKSETGLSVQTGGGVRGETDLEAMFAAGADRVVVGSLAVSQRKRVASWIQRHGNARLVIALDARCAGDGRWHPAMHGWTRSGRQSLGLLVRFYSRVGARHLLCTDISRDGMLSGPNLDLYRLLQQWVPRMELQASGGARDVADINAVRQAGCAGIVLGKTLLEGHLALTDALAC